MFSVSSVIEVGRESFLRESHALKITNVITGVANLLIFPWRWD